MKIEASSTSSRKTEGVSESPSSQKQQHNCSVCHNSAIKVAFHPNLGVPLCLPCNTKRAAPKNAEGDKGISSCLWCGSSIPGLMMVQCGQCRSHFCNDCLSSNFGASLFKRYRKQGKTYKCLSCDRDMLRVLCRHGSVEQVPPTEKGETSKAAKFVICRDISKGAERIEIPVVNEVDNLPAPTDFIYISNSVPGHGVQLKRDPDFLTRCTCKDNCENPRTCECALVTAGFAYDQHGMYTTDKSTGVYECNFLCSCHKDVCRNRTVGRGPQVPLEVFRCEVKNKGWGLRARVDLPIGTYITDYVGEVLNESDSELRGLTLGDEYLFAMDAWGRSRACQLLDDAGLKRTHPTPHEYVTAMSAMTFPELESTLGRTLLQRLSNRNNVSHYQRLEPSKKRKGSDNEDSDEEKAAPSSSSSRKPADATSDKDSIASGSGRKKKKIAMKHEFDPSSLDEGESVVSGPELPRNVYDSQEIISEIEGSARKKRLRSARNVLMDRVMTETESRHDTFTVDAKWLGNVARFLNHSCSPNLEKVTVFTDSQDVRLPKVAFFTNQFIPARTELCYDYGYFQGNVAGKHRTCLCGAANCRGMLY